MSKKEFTDFIFATNTDGSGKASFCVVVVALNMLTLILIRHNPQSFVEGCDFAEIRSSCLGCFL